jgi:glucose repression regulatory protein TUP1
MSWYLIWVFSGVSETSTSLKVRHLSGQTSRAAYYVLVSSSVSSQVNELNIIRQSLYDLESQHGKVRQQYEEEIGRLRAELMATASRQGLPASVPPHPTVGPGSTGPSGIGGSSSAAPGIPGGPSSYNDPYYGRDRELKDRDRDDRDRDRVNRDRDRGLDRDRADRDRGVGDRDRDRERPLDQRDSKRLKTDRIKTDRPGTGFFDSPRGMRMTQPCVDHFSPSLGPGPPIPKLPAPTSAPGGPGLPPPPAPSAHVGYPPAVSSSAHVGSPAEPSNSAGTSLVPISAGSGGFPDDLDPHNVPAELKKEGSDWFAVFNPKVKRVLDVTLVHTLMHERWRDLDALHCNKSDRSVPCDSSVVCCVRFSADGKYLATGCNRTAQIYDTKTGAKTWWASISSGCWTI